ncbi:FkbM family methyltransferase [Fibrella sp. HMF5335]|uniref:FkbM family methyltransferase n=1 Tax=Fibrella rubiginis TaxID=2817060 RepID=A0A939GEA6_9BACT|nr:FkbM family methyltransferase [Fibrella rubiginis]MBO0935136.1 FkbM family methyltransferase [Fibrella rubiginis]
MTTLYQRLKEKKVTFKHVCEVGVYVPTVSNIGDFIKDGIAATLVEADPDVAVDIAIYFSRYNILVHPVAMWDYNGTLQLSKAAASTFVSALASSPALENDGFQVATGATFDVPCKRFSEIDTGAFDLLSIDIEGSEWYVLKYMISRPNVISIETHGKFYVNPFIKEIRQWMQANDYIIWYKDRSDSVYIKRNFFVVSGYEKIALGLKNTWLNLRRQKRHFRKLMR